MFSHQKVLVPNLLLRVIEKAYLDSDKDKPTFPDFLSKPNIIKQYLVLMISLQYVLDHMTYMIKNIQNIIKHSKYYSIYYKANTITQYSKYYKNFSIKYLDLSMCSVMLAILLSLKQWRHEVKLPQTQSMWYQIHIMQTIDLDVSRTELSLCPQISIFCRSLILFISGTLAQLKPTCIHLSFIPQILLSFCSGICPL